MALSFAVLGSGSGGNSTVVLLHGENEGDKPKALLIDAGLSPLATRKRLAPFGLELADLSAILVTHFDSDHFGLTWPTVVEKHELAVYAHHRHRKYAASMLGSIRRVELFRNSFQVDGVDGAVHAALAPHDEHGTASFRIEHRGAYFGFATDVGRFTSDLMDLMHGVDALAIESNYDPDMQRQSGRPAFLKKRIMGGLGHLSNAQSLDAVLELARGATLQHIAALHLSRQCNEPTLIQSLYARECCALLDHLTITSQHKATAMLDVTPGSLQSGTRRARRARPGEQHVLF